MDGDVCGGESEFLPSNHSAVAGALYAVGGHPGGVAGENRGDFLGGMRTLSASLFIQGVGLGENRG